MPTECHKKKYFSEACADRILNYVKNGRKKNKSMRKRKEQRAYKCPICDFWHLTSQATMRKGHAN